MNETAVGSRDRIAKNAATASTAFATRRLRLSARIAAQLIRDVIGGGGEIWVNGSGQSMFPTIRNADAVLLAPLQRAVRRGDIVLVPLGPGLMLHRVVTVTSEKIITRGDARLTNDRPRATADVIARALAVRDGARVTALVPTIRFGVMPLLRFGTQTARRRIVLMRRARDRRARPEQRANR